MPRIGHPPTVARIRHYPDRVATVPWSESNSKFPFYKALTASRRGNETILNAQRRAGVGDRGFPSVCGHAAHLRGYERHFDDAVDANGSMSKSRMRRISQQFERDSLINPCFRVGDAIGGGWRSRCNTNVLIPSAERLSVDADPRSQSPEGLQGEPMHQG